MNIMRLAGLLFCLILCISSGLSGEWELEFESGLVFPGYNDVRIPNNTGTPFSLASDFELKSEPYFRMRLAYIMRDRDAFSFLAAPLSLEGSGISGRQIDFQQTTFPSGTDIDAVYRFDSYRLTYRYEIYRRPEFNLGLGFTAKIRDAAVSLKSENQFAEKTNTGFVPLINFRAQWRPSDKFLLLLEGDALAAPQGRAEELLLAGQYQIGNDFSVRLGYRILEGGADVDEVYSFALLRYFSLALIINL